MSGKLFSELLKFNPMMKKIFVIAIVVMAAFLLGVLAAHASGY